MEIGFDKVLKARVRGCKEGRVMEEPREDLGHREAVCLL